MVLESTTNITNDPGLIKAAFETLTNAFSGQIGFLINIIQAVGIVVIVYLIFLIIKSITSIKSNKRIKNIEKNVYEINQKLNVLISIFKEHKIKNKK